MIEKTNNEWRAMSDSAIIATIGDFIKQKRLQVDKTQSQLANEAGLNRSTVVKIENGESVTLASLIQILRVLDLLYLLNIFTEEVQISPIEYMKMRERGRVRAGKRGSETNINEEPEW